MKNEILYNGEAYNYEKYVVEQRFLNPAKEIAKIIKNLGDNKASFIDLGTGTGVVLFQLYELFGKDTRVFGLDASIDMLNVAREKGANLLINARLPEIPFIDEYFDFSIASFLISHISDYRKFINEVYRVLKPGGYFIFTTWGPGQTEYNSMWGDVIKKYLSENELKRIATTNIPNEALFESKEKVISLFDESRFRHADNYEERYDVPLTMKEYLECRFSLLTASYMKKVLSNQIWDNFKNDIYHVFHKKVGSEIIYTGKVNFFVFQKI